MRQGRPIQDVAAELARQTATRRDFIAPTTKLRAVVVEADERPEVRLAGLPGFDALPFTDLAHRQIGEDLGIPRDYYARMQTAAPALLRENVNHWLAAGPHERMVRTLDGRVRAFLSAKYRPLDHVDLLAAVVPAFQDLAATLGAVEVASCEVTERRLYIKAVMPSMAWDMAMVKREAMLAAGRGTHAEWPGADVVRAAVTIGNSEVGEGRLYVEEGVERLSCYNLATVTRTLRKYHVGRRHARALGTGDDGGDAAWELLSDEARQADDRAFWLRVRDVVKGAFTRERFEATARKFAGAAGDAITGRVERVVEVTAARYGLSDTTRAGVLQALIAGGDLSRFGLINAVTRASQDVADYDAATELEQLGGRLIDLPRQDWEVLASAN